MHARTLLLAAAAAALACLAAAQASQNNRCANRKCFFRFCKADGFDTLTVKGPALLLRGAGHAVSPFVCRPDRPIGRVVTGEALVKTRRGDDPFVPISQYRPAGLSRRFAKRYFRLARIPFLRRKFGVSRRRNRGNQEDFVDDLCVTLPITSYQILNADGSVRKTVQTSRSIDCVTFRTVAPQILIELTWDNADDLDMEVTEPDGGVINLEDPTSDTGRLNRDNNIGSCGVAPIGKEQVRYLKGAGASEGTYRIKVIQFNNCDASATNWRLRVYVDGDTVLDKTGTSTSNADGATLAMESFEL